MFDLLFDNPAVIVQGITGKHGAFHTLEMLRAGTRVMAGVTPGKAGESIHGVEVYNTVAEAKNECLASISIIFVPAPFARAAMEEAIEAGIELIICITEGIPVHDMLGVLQKAKEAGTLIVGPNCPGLLIPSVIKLGIIPESIGLPGSVAVVSRSGTLTYEAAASLSAKGIGQRYIVGIGGDRLRGTSFVDCLRQFQADQNVSHIVLIGEIGGADEQAAAAYIRSHITKPLFAYIVGHSAPPETQLGHAGAIMGSEYESAAAKTEQLRAAGATVASSLPELVQIVAEAYDPTQATLP
ncbi:succinate--CoA ligase subunit alpha [Candidatus Saccharibacteria bacterium]|nr:MAG: succinate--CoA ligase subunit alpha [Candidatus Saccharibacteria bacterium]